MRIEELELSEWGDLLPNEGFSVFHTPEALRAIDKHTTDEMRLLGGFKGQESVGLCPLFIREAPGVRAVLSPPMGYGIQRLGPILMPTSPKQGKREKLNRTFTEKIIESVDSSSPFTLFRISCSTRYTDPRPYGWSGFNIKPAFTYRLDLRSTTPDEVLKSFSKSLRREIRNGDETDISIQTEETAGARRIYEATQSRYTDQGKGFPLSWEFMRDLLEALNDRAQVYTAQSDEEGFLGGIIVLYSNDTAYFWKGGARSSQQNISVNSLLHWRIITDIIDDHQSRESIGYYDLHTANTERIVRYKSKFGGELVPYYQIESTGLPMAISKKVYQMARLDSPVATLLTTR